MRILLSIFLGAILLSGVAPAMADSSSVASKHGIKHKVTKLTADTMLLPAYCVASPLMVICICHSMLPWPPNARSKAECGNSWQYATVVPCLEAVLIPTSPVLCGAFQVGVITKDMKELIVPPN